MRPSSASRRGGAISKLTASAIVWFDRDLRLSDNPALHQAITEGYAVVPAFIWAPGEEAPWAAGAASQWWLHQSLLNLEKALVAHGSRLIVRCGPAAKSLVNLATDTGARFVFWNRRYEPAAIAREKKIEQELSKHGITAASCPGNVLFEPGTILNGTGKPFQVFTAFWRACQAKSPAEPTPPPKRLPAPDRWPASIAISELGLEPQIDWAGGMRQVWQPGEASASGRLKTFLDCDLKTYSTERDRPGHAGTSRLSPHLHFGEVGVRQLWSQVYESAGVTAAATFLREIAWREFSYHLLFHFPTTPQEPLRPEFRSFPWRLDPKALKAWTRGLTGYPLVDSGMRELWQTGWMHNRIRMVAASFLVKHLLIPWQEGAAWFWDTLVDADLANNTMGWQWTAGCGADAAPYFRIFNPILQGEKFDRDGEYVRHWVPELARLPNQWIHKPWQAPGLLLAEAGVELGRHYPEPIVDHDAARKRALAALAKSRGE